ncbi:MAG: DUF4160 domain-containing protein, partial [Cyanobacteria bacterium J06631_9]
FLSSKESEWQKYLDKDGVVVLIQARDHHPPHVHVESADYSVRVRLTKMSHLFCRIARNRAIKAAPPLKSWL